MSGQSLLNSSRYFHEYVSQLRSVEDVIEIHGFMWNSEFFFLILCQKINKNDNSLPALNYFLLKSPA
jgi:hypothetical protein